MRNLMLILIVLFVVSEHVSAQHEDHTSAYKGQEERVIKSLSSDDVKELREGKGWGFAKPAELNGFPGPSHVLEMKEELSLTAVQINEIQGIFNEMNSQAREFGKEFIEAEQALDNAFKNGKIDTDILNSLVAESATARGNLRFVHLEAHLKMMDILSESQIGEYNKLRGYSNGDPCANVPEGHDPAMWKKHNNCSK